MVAGQRLETLLEGDARVWGLAFSPDGQRLVAGTNRERKLRVWDTTTWDLIFTFEGDSATDLAFGPDNRTIITAGGGVPEANLWDIATGQQLLNLAGAPGWVWAVAFSPLGERVASAGVGEAIFLWDAATGELTGELYTGREFTQALAFSPDGTKLASASNRVWVWDMTRQ
jgi:WD40 repeat protein